MLNDIDLTKEEIEELNELIEKLKHIERLAEKSRKEKIMSEIVATLVFLLTGSVMLYIGPDVIGYLIWIALYGFLLYYIFGVRKSDVPEYDE
jgi:fatty acid desaturase